MRLKQYWPKVLSGMLSFSLVASTMSLPVYAVSDADGIMTEGAIVGQENLTGTGDEEAPDWETYDAFKLPQDDHDHFLFDIKTLGRGHIEPIRQETDEVLRFENNIKVLSESQTVSFSLISDAAEEGGEPNEFVEFQTECGETRFSKTDLMDGYGPDWVAFDDDNQTLSITVDKNSPVIWGINICFSGFDDYDKFFANEDYPYFAEIVTNGCGWISWDETKDYPTIESENWRKFISAEPSIEVYLNCDTENFWNSDLIEIRLPVNGEFYDDDDIVYSKDDLESESFTSDWLEFDKETQKVTLKFDDTNKELWGVMINFTDEYDLFGPDEEFTYFAEFCTNGEGWIWFEGENNISINKGNWVKAASKTNSMDIHLGYDFGRNPNANLVEIRIPTDENPDDDIVYTLDDLTAEGFTSEYLDFDKEAQTVTLKFSDEWKEMWGISINFTDPGPDFDSFGPFDDYEYFTEICMNGCGWVWWDETKDYPCADRDNLKRIVSKENTMELYLGFDFDRFKDADLTEIRIPTNENPDDDIVYTLDDLTSEGFTSEYLDFDRETNKVTLKFTEERKEMWAITFNFTDPGQDGPEPNYDDFGPDEEYKYFVETYCEGPGWVFWEQDKAYPSMEKDGVWKKIISKEDTIELNIGLDFDHVRNADFVEIVRVFDMANPDDSVTYTKEQLSGDGFTSDWVSYDAQSRKMVLKFTDGCTNLGFITFRFDVNDNPDNPDGPDNPNPPGPGNDDKLIDIIERQQFAYGDWEMDGDVDTDDLKFGIAQQIYYPNVCNNGNLRDKYEMGNDNDANVQILVNAIDLQAAEENLKAYGIDNALHEIPTYEYTITLDSEDDDYDVEYNGVAYLFDFEGEDAKLSMFDVLLTTTFDGVTTYYLRNAWNDGIDPTTGEKGSDDAFTVIGNYDVDYDSDRSIYIRNVGLFGNGAGLDDFLTSNAADTSYSIYQGRNEEYARDTGHFVKMDDRDNCCIFGKFAFYQESFNGIRVKKVYGTGADGNTPSWAFASDPIFGLSEDVNSVKDAELFFGNNVLKVEPILVSNTMASIEGISVTDNTIPAGAITIEKKVLQFNDFGETETDTNPKWTITFNSNFYDDVVFTVSYKDMEENDKVGYIRIHRVGFAVSEAGGGKAGEKVQLFHGTENGPQYTAQKDSQRIISATYYYPNQNDKAVDLFATYTWKDGSVETRIIKNTEELNLEYHHVWVGSDNPADRSDDCKSSDFILYEGSEADAPLKIEISAVSEGYESTSTFSGMAFGSGRGVVWNNHFGSN